MSLKLLSRATHLPAMAQMEPSAQFWYLGSLQRTMQMLSFVMRLVREKGELWVIGGVVLIGVARRGVRRVARARRV